MKRILAITTAVLATGMLLFSGPAWGYHWDNENSNEAYTSKAGDPGILPDMQDCLDEIGEGGQNHCYVLYAHQFDLLNAVPINIQRPSPDCDSLARGFSSSAPVEPYWEFARMALYSSPGFVEYKEGSCDNPRLHPERGLTSDVVISQDFDIMGYWHLSADALELGVIGLNSGTVDTVHTGVLPCLTVHMRLETGRHLDDSVIASGETTKMIVSSPRDQGMNEDTGVPDPCPDSDGEPITAEEVHEIEVNMGSVSGPIPAHEGFVVGVYWYLHDGGDPHAKDNIYHRDWNLHSGPEYPNRLVLALEDSIRIERVRPQLFDGKIYIHSVLNSPWGSYDVDTANIRVEVENADGELVVDETASSMADPILRYSVNHDGHFLPVNATFPWDFTQDDLEPGDYTIRVTATNWQHTSDASREASFTIREDMTVEARDESGATVPGDRPDDVEESPAFSVALAALAAVVLAGIVSVRRRK